MNQLPILIQVAMEVECQELLKKIDNLKEVTIKSHKFYEGEINNYKVVISLSKVGLIQASSSITIAILGFDKFSGQLFVVLQVTSKFVLLLISIYFFITLFIFCIAL